jgi:hypothetical protein
MVKVFVVALLPLASVAVMVTLMVPVALGVPEITPLTVFIDRPFAGRPVAL